MKFRKKPVIVDAVQWFKDGDHSAVRYSHSDGYCNYYVIRTLEGDMRVRPGDWIITGIKGEHYACRDDIFRETYEAVE